ncbi:hypothetical protein LVJ94_49895 [Pendulispora rubella]|uniref:CYTH domain-containing protein n=1 Tax=Pendulispora rubella TaxID=2741070 RepID=A0ABZ2L722_9BACT
MSESRPLRSKYAHPEYERRWLVRRLPDLEPAVRGSHIDDRYLVGTRLRLRRVVPIEGGPPVYKLGQKVRPDADDGRLVMHTTMYLTVEEHALMSRLPGADLFKTRYHLACGGRTFGLDVFAGRLSGLVLLEIETDPGEELFPGPSFTAREVTRDERYTGGCLAFASDEELAVVLSMGE